MHTEFFWGKPHGKFPLGRLKEMGGITLQWIQRWTLVLT